MRKLLILFAAYYLYKNLIYLLNLSELNNLITTFHTTLKKITDKHTEGHNIERNDFVSLVQKQPALNKFIPFNFYSLSYNQTTNELLENSFGIHRALLGKLDSMKYNWKYELNPFKQLWTLFQVPTNLLAESGITLRKFPSILFNAFIYGLGYFLTMFSTEIKLFILELFQ